MGCSNTVSEAGQADVTAQIDNTEFEGQSLMLFTVIFYTLAKDS